MNVTAIAGDTMDLLCWRHLGRTEGVTEQTLALNPGLSASGPKLNEGQVIILLEITIAVAATRDIINLWD